MAHSEANTVAKKFDLDKKILRRSQEILETIARGDKLRSVEIVPEEKFEQLKAVIDAFFKMEMTEDNLEQILDQLAGLIPHN